MNSLLILLLLDLQIAWNGLSTRCSLVAFLSISQKNLNFYINGFVSVTGLPKDRRMASWSVRL